MKIVSIGLIVALFSTAALATGHAPPPKPAPDPSSLAQSASIAVAGAASHSSSKSSSHSSSNATGGNALAAGGKSNATAKGGAGGSANAAGGAGGLSNVVVDASPIVTSTSDGGEGGASSSDNHLTIEGDEAPRIPVATAIAGGTNTTASCRYSVGAGGQATVLGLSFGFGRKDKDCERFELAQYLYSSGNTEAGDTMLCRIGAMREAFGDECMTKIRRATRGSSMVETSGPDPRLEKKAQFDKVSK